MVDDHALFRESLVRLLESEPNFQVAGHCATITEALQRLGNTRVDVILLDYDLGQEAGTDLLGRLSSCGKKVKVVMVTAGMGDSVTRNALQAGVAGIIFKHSGPGQLIEAIRRVAGGEMWLDSGAIQSLLVASGEARDSQPQSPSLTSRQREVLSGILDGLTNKEIALKMQTSETSVKAIIQDLFQKAGVRTRSQLVRIAFEKHSADWVDRRS
nr:response regulator transcription factor [Paracidobacterium acidisoli]